MVFLLKLLTHQRIIELKMILRKSLKKVPPLTNFGSNFFNNGEISQLKFWKEFLMIYGMQFPPFSQLVQKMIGTSPSNSVKHSWK